MADHLGSSYAAGFISVLMLALAGVTRFGAHLQGAWHVIYVVSAGAALYCCSASSERLRKQSRPSSWPSLRSSCPLSA